MTSQLLCIRPETLEFSVVPEKQSSRKFVLTNAFPQYVAFKVKNTLPKNYDVRPKVGVVAPNSSREVYVTMHALKELPPDMVCNDKFLVQCTAVPAGTTDEDITASMFSKVDGKHIQENIFRVTLVPPFVNGTPKERDFVQKQKTDGQNIVGLDGVKLVKDIEEMKMKVNVLESKLKQVDSTIRSQHELVELIRRKIVEEEHNKFPLLFVFVCVVAVIGIWMYCTRVETRLLFLVVVALVGILIGQCMRF